MGDREFSMVAEKMIRDFMMGKVYLSAEGENRLREMIANRKNVVEVKREYVNS